MAANVDQRLFEVFSRTDSTKAGRLDVAQLQRYLRDHRHLHFSLMSVARLVRLYDTSKTGRLDFAGFVSLNRFLDDIHASFQYYDADGDGMMKKAEVLQALTQSGFQLDIPVFEALFKSFDPTRSQQIGVSEYVALASFLRSASNTFTAYDNQRSARITLDFNQWVYACAQVL